MEKWKKEYDNIVVPNQMKELMEQSIMKAKATKRKKKIRKIWKTAGSVAAVFAILLVLPNTSQTAAAAMQRIPLLGDFFKVVTVREYQMDTERNTANVKVPEVVTDDFADKDQDTLEQAKQSTDHINVDIQKVTDEWIKNFQSTVEEYGEEGYQDLFIDSKVLTDNEKWFSLELILYQGAGSGFEQHRHYTIDKTNGKQPSLADFYGDDYITVISEDIKTQMRQQMAEDEMIHYWVDEEEIPEWNFQAIAEDQDFYVNEAGHVVICFNEYEVAPGYMGCVEFELK